MKNIRISTLFLCALIALSPAQAQAFSLKGIADSIVNFGASVWKTIQNNPRITAGIIGSSGLFVAAVVAAKRNNVSFSMRKGNDKWRLAFNNDNSWFANVKYERIPDSDGETSDNDAELISVDSNQSNNDETFRPQTPPVDPQPKNKRQFAINKPNYQPSNTAPAITVETTSSASSSSEDDNQMNGTIIMDPTQSNDNSKIVNTGANAPKGAAIGRRKNKKRSRLAEFLSSDDDSDDENLPNGNNTSSAPYVIIKNPLSRSGSADSVIPKNHLANNNRRYSSDSTNSWNSLGSLVSSMTIDTNSTRASSHIGDSLGSNNPPNPSTPGRSLAKNSLGAPFGSIRSTRRNGSIRHNGKNPAPSSKYRRQSFNPFALEYLNLGPTANGEYTLNSYTGSMRLKGNKYSLKVNSSPSRSSVDISREKNPSLQVLDVKTIKQWMNNNNENALSQMELSPELKKYPNLVKLVYDIQLDISNNNFRLSKLNKIAKPGKVMALNDLLRALDYLLVNTGKDDELLPTLHAALATVAINPASLLEEVAVTVTDPRTNKHYEETYTQLSLLHIELKNCYASHYTCMRKLSDKKWLLNTQPKTPTQKKKKLAKIWSSLRKTKSDPTEASSSNLNGTPNSPEYKQLQDLNSNLVNRELPSNNVEDSEDN